MRITLMQTLKEQTASAHAMVEAEFRLEERLASRARYLDLLQRLHAFHKAWELTAARWIEPALEQPRRKARRLRDDIAALGSEPDDRFTPPRFAFVADTASALGAMYVVEGSMLGGALIAKEVNRRLGLTGENGCSFFRAYGVDLAARWREFGAYVNVQAAAHNEAVLIAAADAMFDAMRLTLVAGARSESSVAA